MAKYDPESASSVGDLYPYIIRSSFSPPRVHNPNSISIGSAVFWHCTQHMLVTNRQTDCITAVTVGRTFAMPTLA